MDMIMIYEVKASSHILTSKGKILPLKLDSNPSHSLGRLANLFTFVFEKDF